MGRLSEKIEEETLRNFFDKEAKQIVDSASVIVVHHSELPADDIQLCSR